MFVSRLSCLLGVVLAVSAVPVPERKSYQGYQLWRVNATTDEQFQFLENLWVNETQMNLDFWQPPRRRQVVEFLVPPAHIADLRSEMEQHSIHIEPVIFNVESTLQKSRKQSSAASNIQFDDSTQGLLSMQVYHSFDEILQYLRALRSRYPNLVQTIKIGTTHDGRAIELIKITNSQRSEANKRAIWIDAGIHAREWIAPAAALYFINQLVEKYDSNAKSRELVDNLIWYILPVVNPDGYEYSRLYDRMWRKNRNPNGGQFSEACKGVDLNRNFDFFWTGKGSSPNPCKEIYRGESPFSEPESRAIRDFVLQHNSQIQAFITLHSYSQIWMYPYGHDYNNYPADVNELRDVALRAANKVESFYGTRYVVDTGANALYPASGGSDDWSKGKAGIKYVYLIELRPNDYSIHGFLLPENQIIPTGRETWAGIQVVADEVQRRNGITPIPPDGELARIRSN